MTNPLLATKFYFPPGRPVLVPRPRLVERLQAGLKGPLTLISAPAGSGKTTLLSEWRAGPGAGVPVAWLSLDADDNDPARLFQYLFACLGTLHPSLAINEEISLQSTEGFSPEAILTPLINALNATPQDFILVLDDYHRIELPTIHMSLGFLVDHLPARLHLAILTRSDPPLPLARLRVRGQLTEIRAEHLRFSGSEAAQFLNQIMGLALTDEQVSALELRTEGWIAGLQLAALSLRGQDDVEGLISSFSGSNRYIVDYLVEEVLTRQPKELREFLLKTSVLERLTGSLCDTLTEKADGANILAALEAANLFIVPLDNDRRWYRYHHLFSDLLQSRLLHSSPGIVKDLHRRAADWFAANGLIEEAINHALEAKDFDKATLLIEQTMQFVTRQGRVATVSKWIGALPEEIIARKPKFGFLLAWTLYLEYKFDQAEVRIQQLERT